MGRADEATVLSHEWAGDDARNVMRRDQHLTSDRARVVQRLEWHYAFVRGNLEDGIRRRVNDELPGLHVVGPKPLDHLRPAGDDISNDATTDAARKLIDDLS